MIIQRNGLHTVILKSNETLVSSIKLLLAHTNGGVEQAPSQDTSKIEVFNEFAIV